MAPKGVPCSSGWCANGRPAVIDNATIDSFLITLSRDFPKGKSPKIAPAIESAFNPGVGHREQRARHVDEDFDVCCGARGT
jgi:hypothetical protein